jgi:flagellar biosynthesis component FlhA
VNVSQKYIFSDFPQFLVDFQLGFSYTIVISIALYERWITKSLGFYVWPVWLLEETMEITEIVPAHFEDGTEIHVVATILGGREEDVAAREENFSFENVTKPIKKIAEEVAKIIKDVQPDKATVSLGFEVAASEGQLTALLVKGTANASLAVTLEWVKEKEEKQKPNRPRKR